MMHWSLDVDFWRAATDRILQASGLAFLFVPINTGAYAFLAKEKNGNASGLMNLARNIGGSIGVAVVTTLLDRKAQVHQSMLVSHLTPFDEAYRSAVGSVARDMQSVTSSAVDATSHALGVLSHQLSAQASMLATLDSFSVLASAFVVGVPLTLVLKSVAQKKGPLAVH
jgi:DHA2 family multidrug resistance protein